MFNLGVISNTPIYPERKLRGVQVLKQVVQALAPSERLLEKLIAPQLKKRIPPFM
jgi:hypothetical protein